MTQEEKEEYNKRCAEFLGYKLIKAEDFNKLGEAAYTGDNSNVKWGIIEYLKFHSDWNWIMEVSQKIEELGGWVQISSIIDRYTCTIRFGEKWITISNVFKETKKEAVVEAINQFLIWYNENNK